MSFETIRAEIATKLQAVITAFDPTVLTQFENQESVDMNVASYFVDVSIKFMGGEKVSMEVNSPTRYNGELQTHIVCKAGSGTKRSLEIAEAIARGLEYQKIGKTQMKTPRPLAGRSQGDWYSIPLMTSFYTDTN